MSDNINQSYNLDASKTLNQLTQLSKKINAVGLQLATLNRLTLNSVKITQSEEAARRSSVQSIIKQAKAFRDAANNIRELSNTGKNLKEAFSKDLLSGALGNVSHLKTYETTLAKIGQASQLTYAQIKGVFNEVNRLGDGAQYTNPKMKALFVSFKAVNDEALRVENYKLIAARMLELAEASIKAKTAQEAQAAQILNTKIALQSLDKQWEKLQASMNANSRLTQAEQEARRTLITATDKLRSNLAALTEQEKSWTSSITAGLNAVRLKQVALQSFIQTVQQAAEAEKKQQESARNMEALLRENFQFFGKVDTRTRVELDLIVASLVRMREEGELTGSQFDRMLLNVANNTGKIPAKFAALAKAMMPLTDSFRDFAHLNKKATEATFAVGEAVKANFIDKFNLAEISSERLRNQFLRLADNMGQLAQKSGMNAKEFNRLIEAMEGGNYSAKVVKDNTKVAQSVNAIILKKEELLRLEEQLIARQKLGQSAVDTFRLQMPGPANNPAFIKETDQMEQRIRKIAEASNLTKKQLDEMISNAVIGKTRDYIRQAAELVRAKSAAGKMSLEQADAIRAEGEHLQRVNNDIRRSVQHYRELIKAKKLWAVEAVKNIHLVSVSWRSYIRYFLTRTAYRAFMSLITSIRTGMQAAFDLQQRIAEIRTITQDSAKGVANWTQELRQLSDAFPQTTLDIAEGAYQALSNQVARAGEVTMFLREALRLSITTMSTTAEAVNTVSSVLKSYNMDATMAGEVSAQLFRIVELGRLRLADIANEMGNVTVVAAQLGISFEEVGASLTTLTRQGVTPATAMTLLRNVLMKLIGPTGNMKDLFKEWGVNSAEAAVETFGFFGVLQKLSVATKGDLTEINELFSRIRATTGFAGLTGGENLKQYEQDLASITASVDAYNEATRRAFDNTAMKLRIEMQQLRNYFSVDIGNVVIRTLDEANTGLGGLTNVVRGLTSNFITLFSWVGDVAAVLARMPKVVGFIAHAYASLIIQLKLFTVVQALANTRVMTQTVRIKNLTTALMKYTLVQKAATLAKKGWAQVIFLAATAVVSYLYLAEKMRKEAFERGTRALLESTAAWEASRVELKKQEAELNRVQLAEKELTDVLRIQRQVSVGARAANFKLIDGLSDKVKELGVAWKAAFKDMEKATDTSNLTTYTNAVKSAKDIIKGIEEQQFASQFDEPILGFANLDEQFANLTAKAEAFGKKSGDSYGFALGSVGEKLTENLEDARSYFNSSLQALREADQAGSQWLQQRTQRMSDIQKELTELRYISADSYSDFRTQADRRSELEKELRELQKNEPSVLAQTKTFRAQIEEALKRQLTLEKEISAEMEARAKREEARLKRLEANNERAGEAFSTLTALDLTNVTSARQTLDTLTNTFPDLLAEMAKRGPEGLAAAQVLRETFQETAAALSAAEQNAILDKRDEVINQLGEKLRSGTDELKATINGALNSLEQEASNVSTNLKQMLEALALEKIPTSIGKTLVNRSTGLIDTSYVVDSPFTEERNALLEQARFLQQQLDARKTDTGFTGVDTAEFQNLLAQIRQVQAELAKMSVTPELQNTYLVYIKQAREIQQQIETVKTAEGALTTLLSEHSNVVKALNDTTLSTIELNELYKQIAGSDAINMTAFLEQLSTSEAGLRQILTLATEEGVTAIQKGLVDPIGVFTAALSGAKSEATALTFILQRALSLKNAITGSNETPVGLNSGGWVPGSGNTDKVPALLTPGEFVVNKQQAASFAPMLEAMNRGTRSNAVNSSTSTTYGDATVNFYGGQTTDVSPETARQIAELIYREKSRGRVR